MVGIWCVELVGQESAGRWARHGSGILKFDTEEEALAEAQKLRAKYGYWARGHWLFFASPISDKSL